MKRPLPSDVALWATVAALCIGISALQHSAHAEKPACHFDSDGRGRVEPPDIGLLQCYPAPDKSSMVMVKDGAITVVRNGTKRHVGQMDYGRILWNPTSAGFAIADSHGSGETEEFSYVSLASEKPRLSRRLTSASVRRFKTAFHCGGARAYANTITDGWTSDGKVRLVVQDGVHSEGCNPPGGMIGVIGDPLIGRIDRVLDAVAVGQEWCSAGQRRQYGYCYDEAAATQTPK